jgi:6-phosphogluconolactonase
MHIDIIELSDLISIANSAASFLKPSARVALSMGSTFSKIYPHWKDKVCELKPIFYPVDERIVPLNYKDSNWGLANKLLFKHCKTDNSLSRFAASVDEYVRIIQSDFANSLPRFDLIFLGLGVDGHTASLFPGYNYPDEPYVQLSSSQNHPHSRITLSPAVLKAAKDLVVVVMGAEKKHAINSVLKGTSNSPLISIINSRDKTTLIIEKGILT